MLPHLSLTRVSLQLELANMFRKGEISELWQVANQTDLTFNLVRFASINNC